MWPQGLPVTILWTVLVSQNVMGHDLRVMRLQMSNDKGAGMDGGVFGTGVFGGGMSHFCAFHVVFFVFRI